MTDFQDKVVCITGASGGIGRALVRRFAEAGATLVVCAHHQTTEFDAFLDSIRTQFDVAVYPFYFDLSDDDSIDAGLKGIKALKLKINVLINNAGVPHIGLLMFNKMSDMKSVFQINYFAQLKITQSLIGSMVKNGGSSIINAASIAGIEGDIGNSIYGATKASMILFTKVLAKELAKMNIRVNAVAPGLTDTHFASIMGDKAKSDMESRSLMQRMATAQEVADVYYYLASSQSSFINGQVIRVDGGI